MSVATAEPEQEEVMIYASSKDEIYVLQVVGGQEEHARSLIQNILPGDAYSEVFIPRYKKQVRRKGVWNTEEYLLTPGYLYLETDDASRANHLLRRVPALTKLVRSAGSVLPLAEEEMTWLNSLTSPESRTVDTSYGFIEGDQVVVTSGPLFGQESHIVKIDRHKRLAYLEFLFLGRTKLVTVGLEIVEKRAVGANSPSRNRPHFDKPNLFNRRLDMEE